MSDIEREWSPIPSSSNQGSRHSSGEYSDGSDDVAIQINTQSGQFNDHSSIKKETKYVNITIFNLLLIVLIFIPFMMRSDLNSTYVRFGPGPDLHILWLKVDTWPIYIATHIFLAIFSAFETYREETIYPWMTNNLYDHKQKIISDYTRTGVFIIANGNFISDAMYYMIAIWIAIIQIDFALAKILVCSYMNYRIMSRYIGSKKFM